MVALPMATKTRTWPVSEVFGPTVQGEGPMVGARCWFVRLAGCDFRCSWCDTPYAVLPELIREDAVKMTGEQIRDELRARGWEPGGLVIVSGGNPASHHAAELIEAIDDAVIHIETQGSVWRGDWLNDVDMIVVSPKPPSSGMASVQHESFAKHFVTNIDGPEWCLKFVAFDEADLDWAVRMRDYLDPGHRVEAFISAGTLQDTESLRDAAVESFAWLANRAADDPRLAAFRVGLQLHVLAWPGERDR